MSERRPVCLEQLKTKTGKVSCFFLSRSKKQEIAGDEKKNKRKKNKKTQKSDPSSVV